MKKLIADPQVLHPSWKGLSAWSLRRTRALAAWPNRKILNGLEDADAEPSLSLNRTSIKPLNGSTMPALSSFCLA